MFVKFINYSIGSIEQYGQAKQTYSSFGARVHKYKCAHTYTRTEIGNVRKFGERQK